MSHHQTTSLRDFPPPFHSPIDQQRFWCSRCGGGVTRSLPAFPSSLLPSRMRWDGMETIQRKQQGEGWTAPAHRQHLGSPCSPLSVQGPGTSSPPGPDPGGASGLLPSHPAPEETPVPLAGNAAAEQTLPVPPLNYLMSYRSR